MLDEEGADIESSPIPAETKQAEPPLFAAKQVKVRCTASSPLEMKLRRMCVEPNQDLHDPPLYVHEFTTRVVCSHEGRRL